AGGERFLAAVRAIPLRQPDRDVHPPARVRSPSVITRRKPRRRPAAAVELALVAPFLVAAFLGIFEVGRALLVKESLSNAAQRACRTASLPAKANSDVNQDVQDVLSAAGITGYSTTVLVNGTAGEVGTATRNDKISVQVSVPASQVFWLTTYFVQGSMV